MSNNELTEQEKRERAYVVAWTNLISMWDEQYKNWICEMRNEENILNEMMKHE